MDGNWDIGHIKCVVITRYIPTTYGWRPGDRRGLFQVIRLENLAPKNWGRGNVRVRGRETEHSTVSFAHIVGVISFRRTRPRTHTPAHIRVAKSVPEFGAGQKFFFWHGICYTRTPAHTHARAHARARGRHLEGPLGPRHEGPNTSDNPVLFGLGFGGIGVVAIPLPRQSRQFVTQSIEGDPIGILSEH